MVYGWGFLGSTAVQQYFNASTELSATSRQCGIFLYIRLYQYVILQQKLSQVLIFSICIFPLHNIHYDCLYNISYCSAQNNHSIHRTTVKVPYFLICNLHLQMHFYVQEPLFICWQNFYENSFSRNHSQKYTANEGGMSHHIVLIEKLELGTNKL